MGNGRGGGAADTIARADCTKQPAPPSSPHAAPPPPRRAVLAAHVVPEVPLMRFDAAVPARKGVRAARVLARRVARDEVVVGAACLPDLPRVVAEVLPAPPCGPYQRRVRLVRRDGRDVSTLYGRGGGEHAPQRTSCGSCEEQQRRRSNWGRGRPAGRELARRL